MPSTIEQKIFALKKEAVRGVAEATPDQWRAVNADSELTYTLAFAEDETKRGINAKHPAAPTIKDGEGPINFPVRASEIGEFLHMAIGDPVTTTPDGATLARLHTFKGPIGGVQDVQRPSYTYFLERGISVKKYSLGQVNELAFTQDPDGLMQMAAATFFKTEEPGSIGTPIFTGESEEAEPDLITVKLDDVVQAEVRQISATIANNLFKKRTFNQTKDLQDIIAVGPMSLAGGFEIFFETEAERVKFLAATQVKIDYEFVGGLVESGQNFELKLAIPTAKYRALPFGDLDGILGATVEWEAEFDRSSASLFSALLVNARVSY